MNTKTTTIVEELRNIIQQKTSPEQMTQPEALLVYEELISDLEAGADALREEMGGEMEGAEDGDLDEEDED